MRVSYLFSYNWVLFFAVVLFYFITLGFDGEIRNCQELEQNVDNHAKHGKPLWRMCYDSIIGYAVTM